MALLESLAAYAEQLTETPISLANQTESQPNLVNDLNKLAEQNVNKAEKLKMLKALIQQEEK